MKHSWIYDVALSLSFSQWKYEEEEESETGENCWFSYTCDTLHINKI